MSDGAQPYTARPALTRLPGERWPTWTCACNVPRYKRHTEPYQCVSAQDVAAWRAAHPSSGIVNDVAVRCLVWLAREFRR